MPQVFRGIIQTMRRPKPEAWHLTAGDLDGMGLKSAFPGPATSMGNFHPNLTDEVAE